MGSMDVFTAMVSSRPAMATSMMGHGIEHYSNGDRYEGQFACGCKHGAGTYTSGSGVMNPLTYQGQFNEDQMDGQGTYGFPDGRKYVGQWSNGHMKGSGKMSWPNGSMYEGEYEQGMKHGNGVFSWPDGRSYSGTWQH